MDIFKLGSNCMSSFVNTLPVILGTYESPGLHGSCGRPLASQEAGHEGCHSRAQHDDLYLARSDFVFLLALAGLKARCTSIQRLS